MALSRYEVVMLGFYMRFFAVLLLAACVSCDCLKSGVTPEEYQGAVHAWETRNKPALDARDTRFRDCYTTTVITHHIVPSEALQYCNRLVPNVERHPEAWGATTYPDINNVRFRGW